MGDNVGVMEEVGLFYLFGWREATRCSRSLWPPPRKACSWRPRRPPDRDSRFEKQPASVAAAAVAALGQGQANGLARARGPLREESARAPYASATNNTHCNL